MKLAIPYDNGQVFQHFGKTEAFKIYDIVDGKVGPSMVMSTNGQGHGALAGLLRGLGISAVICGGIGPGAIEALQSLDITPSPASPGTWTRRPRTLWTGSWSPTQRPSATITTMTMAIPALLTPVEAAAATPIELSYGAKNPRTDRKCPPGG
ncbi:MAG: NifB/NifX family molybdenum-iron cluster-binding protein [Evtepia gabavorous]